MMIKIYFQSKILFLTDTITPEIDDYLHRNETIFIDELNRHSVKTMIGEMEKENMLWGIFLHSDMDELLELFKQELVPIKAAGGLVFDEKKNILLIFRRGKWDLPKGKVEDGEELNVCAVREVEEETGLEKVKLKTPLLITYHTYYEKGQHVLKESHWYTMQASSTYPLKPQIEEDIMECKWVPVDQIEPYFDQMHASIRDVVAAGLKK